MPVVLSDHHTAKSQPQVVQRAFCKTCFLNSRDKLRSRGAFAPERSATTATRNHVELHQSLSKSEKSVQHSVSTSSTCSTPNHLLQTWATSPQAGSFMTLFNSNRLFQ